MRLGAHTEKTAAFVKQGEYPSKNIDDKVSLASLMQIIHTLYNTDEAITK